MTILGGVPASLPFVDERSVLRYVSQSGAIFAFTDLGNGVVVEPGIQGLGVQPYGIITEELPALDGAVLRAVRSTSREVFVPLFVEAPSRQALLEKLRQLANIVDPRYGGGQLQLLERDGSGRRIPALYTGGMEGDEGNEVSGLHWQRFGLTFRCLDPAWNDMFDMSFAWTQTDTTAFFPILPLALINDQILGSGVPIQNIGDEVAYPRWTIRGKTTAMTFTNTTTGAAFTLNHSMADATHWVTIDTRPGVKTVIDETGANKWAELGANPDLWPLVPGQNTVNLTVTGTDATTVVQMVYTPRYKTAA